MNTMQYNVHGELILAQCGKNLEMKLVVIQAKFDSCFIQKQKQTCWQLLCAFFISGHSFYFVFLLLFRIFGGGKSGGFGQ